MSAIEVAGLRKSYGGGVEALRGVDFRVAQGEVFALLGPNGAGKSTTIKILTTLSRADSGTAVVAGHDVLGSPQEVRKRIGYVAQESGVDELATGRENLVLQGRVHGLSSTRLGERVDELLDLFRLENSADRMVRTYSGGMKRRLDVAMGLVHLPEILFLDEPTTGLDPESRSVMWDEVRRFAREGLTILLTTHYLEEADELAARLAIIDEGKVVAEGSPESLKGDLRGDLIEVELADEAVAAAAMVHLGSVDGVLEVMNDGRLVFAEVAHGDRMVPAALTALERRGIGVSHISMSRPSLDDVYLHATGHAYNQDGRPGGGDRS